MTAPDWLTLHDGNLTRGLSDDTYLVTLDGHPLYRLEAVPANGQFTCVVTQTNNGKRVDAGAAYPTRDGALAGGADELRAKLGW